MKIPITKQPEEGEPGQYLELRFEKKHHEASIVDFLHRTMADARKIDGVVRRPEHILSLVH